MDLSRKIVKRIAWFLFVPVINFIIKDTENQRIIYKIRHSFINKIMVGSGVFRQSDIISPTEFELPRLMMIFELHFSLNRY